MREIKFRGKRIYNGELVFGSHRLFKNGTGNRHFIIDYDEPINGGIEYEVDPATVGQYTGLKDKNGVEIYEGDIVQYHPEANMGTGPVVYELGAFRVQGDFDALLYHFSLKALEVIGNVWEDGGLLNDC